MGEVSAAGDRDPYMQAYITARMKNQVEEMKLQKLLSSMEMSQRLRKIMINLEVFEDRKNAHRLQKEVRQISTRQRKSGKRNFNQQAAREHMTSAWTSSLLDPDTPPNPPIPGTNDLPAGEVTTQPHPPPLPVPSSPSKGVYLATKGRECGWRGEERGGTDSGPPQGRLALAERWATAVQHSAVPAIVVTDCCSMAARKDTAAAPTPRGGGRRSVDLPVHPPEQGGPSCNNNINNSNSNNNNNNSSNNNNNSGEPGSGMSASNLTTTSPPAPPMSAPQHLPHPPPPVLHAHSEHHNSPPGVHFPPVCRSTARPWHVQSQPPSRERKRLPSASQLWPGDPRAISSVRRERRNIQEMVSSMKAGEETRRLLRGVTPSCSRNCAQPDLLTQLEKAYVNLPDLLPEIEKARQRLAEGDDPDQQHQASLLGLVRKQGSGVASAGKRRAVGRFDLEEDGGDQASIKNLPIYHIDYKSLRNIGDSRKNSILV